MARDSELEIGTWPYDDERFEEVLTRWIDATKRHDQAITRLKDAHEDAELRKRNSGSNHREYRNSLTRLRVAHAGWISADSAYVASVEEAGTEVRRAAGTIRKGARGRALAKLSAAIEEKRSAILRHAGHREEIRNHQF